VNLKRIYLLGTVCHFSPCVLINIKCRSQWPCTVN